MPPPDAGLLPVRAPVALRPSAPDLTPLRRRKAPSLITTVEGGPCGLAGAYRGTSLFILYGGPSLATLDLSWTQARGICTMAVNNSWALFRPHLWCSVDPPRKFLDTGWRDPGILKFIPRANLNQTIRTPNAEGVPVDTAWKARDMPGVFAFTRNTNFDPETFFEEDAIAWGCGKQPDALGFTGARSVMHCTLRLAHWLGFSHAYLVGCDFTMSEVPGQPIYAFDETKSAHGCRSNNTTYRILNARFAALQAVMVARDMPFRIYNCTPGSGLTAFPFRALETAVEAAKAQNGQGLATRGWYT